MFKLYTVKLRPGRGAEETLASTQGKAPSMVVDYTVFHNFSSIKIYIFSIFQVIMLRNFTSEMIGKVLGFAMILLMSGKFSVLPRLGVYIN